MSLKDVRVRAPLWARERIPSALRSIVCKLLAITVYRPLYLRSRARGRLHVTPPPPLCQSFSYAKVWHQISVSILIMNDLQRPWCRTSFIYGSSSISVQDLLFNFLSISLLGKVCVHFGQDLFFTDRPCPFIMAYAALCGRFGGQGLSIEIRLCPKV